MFELFSHVALPMQPRPRGGKLRRRNADGRKQDRRARRMTTRAKWIGIDSLESRVLLDGSPYGLSSFTPLGDSPVIVAGPTGLNGAPLMDLNGDGMGDLIVEYGNGTGTGGATVAAVSALLVNADGSSTEYRIARYAIPTAAGLPVIDQVLVADFNGDGQPDVAVLRNDGTSISPHRFIDIFMGQTNGTFTQPASIDLGTAVATPTMTLFDQNGDGRIDIFLEDTSKLTAYLGNGDGTFAAPVVTNFQTLLFPLSLNKLSTITNASFQDDLSGDGIPDLVVSGEVPSFARTGTQYALYVFKGQASGSYNIATPSFSETTDNLTLLTLRQLSSDNKMDIVAYSSTAGPDVASSIFVFRNTGNGTFTQSFHSQTFSLGLPTIALGLNAPKQPLLTPDLTGDGVNDMILVEGGLGTNTNVTLHIEKNNGNGGFTETQQIPFVSSPYDSSGLVEDVDGDHLPDLVVYRDVYPSVLTTIYFNHGGGVFDATGLVPIPSSSVQPGTAPGLADFNGDGKLDLVYTGSSVSVEVLLNTTGRAFGPGIDTVLSAPESGPNLVRYQVIPPDPILDYTGDGLPDLLSYNGDGFSILAGASDGHFTALKPYVGTGGATPIATDINHDGKIDLIWGPLPALAQFDENPPSIFVDINGATTPTDTAGADMATARDLGTLSGPIALDAFMNTTWGEGNNLLHASDFYKFTLTSPQVVSITAVPAAGQVGLSLEDSSGTGIASGSNGLLPVIDATLDAGTYYVAVANSDVVDTHYELNIAFPTGAASIGVRQGFGTLLNNQTTSIDFGNVLVTTTDTHKVFTIQNTGLDTLNLNAISLPAGFELDGAAPPSTLAAGATATFSVMMDTSSTGQYSDTITISSPDPLVNNFSFPVSGSVTGPVLDDLSGQFVSSPAVPSKMIAGASAPLSFALNNNGPGAANGAYSVTFLLEKGAAQLGKGDVAAGTASGAIALFPGMTTIPIAASFTVPANLAAGTYFLAATITDGGGDIDTNAADKTFFSGPITIGPPPTHIAFLTQPPKTTIAGQAIGPVTVQLLDATNHVVAGNADVTIALTPNASNATLGGTLTVQAVNGVATFNGLSLTVAGGFTFTVTSGGLTSPKSGTFSILPDAASASLFIAHQPVDTTVGQGMTPPLVVDIQDEFGNVINTGTYSTSTVTLGIASGPGDFGGKATVSVKAAKGIATFSNVALSMAGTYTLGVTDGTLGVTPPVQFTQVITQGITSVAVPRPAKSYIFGQAISLTNTFKSTATKIPFTGTADIVDQDNHVLGTATLSANGAIKFALTGVVPGTYDCVISYAGDVDHAAVTSSNFTLLINTATTKTTLTASSATLVFGQPLTLTATVASTTAPGTPRTGNINFYDGATLLQTVALDGNSTASWTFTPDTVGKHSYKAVYAGDSDFAGGTSAVLARTVAKDKTSIQLALEAPATSPLPHNQTFNLDVHVSVIAPGSSNLTGTMVTIKDNGKVLGTVNLDGNGEATLAGLSYSTSGAHSLTAVFAGDVDTLAVTSSALKLSAT